MRRIALYMLAMSLLIAPAALSDATNRDAGFDLLKELRHSEGQFVCSPLSMKLAVRMAVEGAAGDTLTELENIAGDVAMSQFSGLSALKTANLAIISDNCAVLDEYRNALTDNCDAETIKMSNDIVNKVNAFVSENTGGKITELLTEQPPLDLKLMLVNAVAFEDEWLFCFDEDRTGPAPFHAPGGDVTVQMMHLKAGLDCSSTDSLKAVMLPYVGDRLSMICVLPEDGYMDEVIDALAEGGLSAIGEFEYEGDVQLDLPKLKLVSRLSLNSALRALGVVDAFSDAADFSGITGDKSLYISDVTQAAIIDINESGTSAAAATSIMMMAKGINISKPVELTFDRPYIVMIVDEVTGELAFAAIIDDPSAL